MEQAKGASSEVPITDRITAGVSTSCDKAIKNDTEAELAAELETVSLSPEEEKIQQKPVPDEIIYFIAGEFNKELDTPPRGTIYPTLQKKIPGFDKLDNKAQNRLIENASEKIRAINAVLKLPEPEIIELTASQNSVRHRRPHSQPLS
ncbi:hypothetical protein [Endozoicomonas sp. YOMI1]|uniref:hypothetical protein n=1 Tax=Endozoicomonas sp. YOMI1 TaxID=2828739 RepID=UPI002147D73C|nr:hypothetical protein [Endozoicomonas sp. YOMI1]